MTDYLASAVWAGASYRITQPYGPTTLTVEPLLNGQHFHAGIDIATPLRTPLFSPVSGKVVHLSTALLAITDMADCFWMVHIDASVVTLSQWVSKGQLVAYSGNKVPSGGSTTGAHLHFEVQNYPGARTAYYNEDNGRLIVPAGALNNPATSLDPVPVLSGRFSASGGALEGDMPIDKTDPEWILLKNMVIQIQNLLVTGKDSFPGYAGAADIPTSAELLKAVQARPPASPDPTLGGKIDALAKHLGQGTA